MSEFIEVLSKEALADIDKLIKAIKQGTVDVDKLNTEFKQLKLPSEFLEGLKKYNAETRALNALEKETLRQQKALNDSIAKKALAHTDENKAIQRIRKETNEYNRQLRIGTGLYAKVNAAVQKVSKRYNDLALRQELSGKLSAKETRELERLTAKLGKYQGALAKVDANIGKYNRNVGNYASGWNGLSNSINQLTREAPAFANSLQTGFMALSNNIPILIDEIDVLRRKNMALAKEGKATKSVFGQVASAFFSWQTALSVGVTILTLYGKEIVEATKNYLGLGVAASRALEIQKKLNEELANIASQTIPKFKALVSVTQDLTRTNKERLAAMQELNNEYPDFNSNILTEENNTNAVSKAITNYITKLKEKALAQAAMNLAQEKYNEFIQKEQEIQEFAEEKILKVAQARDKNIKTIGEAIRAFSELSENIQEGAKTSSQRNKADDVYGRILDGLTKKQIERSMIEQEINELLSKYVSNTDFSIKNTEKLTKAVKELVKAQEEFVSLGSMDFQDEVLPGSIRMTQMLLNKFKQLRDGQLKGTNQWRIYNDQVEEFQRLLDNDFVLDFAEKIDDIATSTEKLGGVFEKVFGDDSLLWTQLTRLGNLLNINADTIRKTINVVGDENANEEDRRRALAVGTEEIISGLAQTSFLNNQVRIQNEIELNRRYYDDLIKQAEGNEQQQELLREERDRKERELRRKQVQAERENALFEIAINTASAIVQALPNIPLSIAVGAIGAVQAAIVQSQPLPEFKDGVKNFKGGYAVLGDGGKNEPIVDKFGNLKGISPNTDTVMHLDKGDSVYSSMSDLPDSVLEKTMLYNLTASSKSLSSYGKNAQNGLDAYQFERAIINSLKKAKFINNNKNNIDLGQELKLLKYKGR